MSHHQKNKYLKIFIEVLDQKVIQKGYLVHLILANQIKIQNKEKLINKN